jgi:CBS domain-containing protein
MADRIRDVMTANPQTLSASATVREAAETMRAHYIGDVIASDDDVIASDDKGGIAGIVTDRDIVVRVVAEGRDPRVTLIEEIVSRDLSAVSPDDPVERAVELMRERAVRRLPVVKRGKVVGIVSIGDLAVERDPRSVLADISAAPPNT